LISDRHNYQIPRISRRYALIETSLAKLNHMAAEVLNALMIDTAGAEYSAPKKDPA
jgi:hypothetical protein